MSGSFVRRLGRFAVRTILPYIDFDTGLALAREILTYQGFGSGGAIATSGELDFFKLVTDEAPTLFDVGAHIGEYTQAFLDKFPRGRAYLFEPSATHFETLLSRIGESHAVHAFQLALGATPGQSVLYSDADISGLASLTRRRLDHFGIQINREEQVTVSTVDEMRSSNNIDFIHLLKIDVEGNELNVLNGAALAFKERAIGLVQFEFGGCNLDSRTNLHDFFGFFNERRYHLYVIQPSGRLQLLKTYNEMYEQYRTTNYAALPMTD